MKHETEKELTIICTIIIRQVRLSMQLLTTHS